MRLADSDRSSSYFRYTRFQIGKASGHRLRVTQNESLWRAHPAGKQTYSIAVAYIFDAYGILPFGRLYLLLCKSCPRADVFAERYELVNSTLEI
jgi:hypothetical protein